MYADDNDDRNCLMARSPNGIQMIVDYGAHLANEYLGQAVTNYRAYETHAQMLKKDNLFRCPSVAFGIRSEYGALYGWTWELRYTTYQFTGMTLGAYDATTPPAGVKPIPECVTRFSKMQAGANGGRVCMIMDSACNFPGYAGYAPNRVGWTNHGETWNPNGANCLYADGSGEWVPRTGLWVPGSQEGVLHPSMAYGWFYGYLGAGNVRVFTPKNGTILSLAQLNGIFF
jgi:prepilin-type processing-associated H-X9-DG protein